nr:ribonuclease H-like domain-containing protein [Tanacetum cinerariifolium]
MMNDEIELWFRFKEYFNVRDRSFLVDAATLRELCLAVLAGLFYSIKDLISQSSSLSDSQSSIIEALGLTDLDLKIESSNPAKESVGNKMLKAFPLPEDFHTASEERFPLLSVTITMSLKVVEPISRTTSSIRACREALIRRRITPKYHSFSSQIHLEMEHSNPTLAKIPILDTGKFKQWKFKIQQYLQNKHYALWEVIEFGDSYEAPKDVVDTGSTSEGSAKKNGRTVAVTTEDMQKRRNDVKARTTLLLALPDEHQLRFNKYKTAQELWAAILKTFGGNEATRKTKKNQLKQQYGNFKAKGKETLEQTFNRLQAIVRHLEFMDVEIEQDDLNQKLLTSLAPEWLMHTIVWRNRSDLDTMSLDDLYNHLKVYEPEVQKKLDSQNMAFISSTKNSSGNGEVNTASIPTATSQSSGSQIKYEDINQIDEDNIEEMDIKWATLLGSAGNPGAKIGVEEKTSNKESPIEFALMAKSSSDTEVEARPVEFKNQEIKFRKKIRGLEFKVESKTNRIKCLTNELEILKKEKEGLDSKLTGFQSTSKDLDTLLGSQRPSPNIESKSNDLQNNSSSVSENGELTSSILSKPEIKFVKAADSPTVIKINKDETVRKPSIKYAEIKFPTSNSKLSTADLGNKGEAVKGNSQNVIDDKGYWDSGCSRHMTGNISYLLDYEPYDGGYVSFGQGGCKITGKGTIKTGKLEFQNVYFVKDLKYNLFSVSQICDNKNSILFTDSECIVLGRDFKLRDDTNVLLRTHRQHNMYSIVLNNIVPHKDLTCLVAKVSADESELWHRRLGHLNFKTMDRLVRHNLVKGLPSKCFDNDHTCVACLKGKQHKASYKTNDETSGILRNFISVIENLKDLKVKSIRCDNRGEFRNKEMNDFCSRKGIKREFSNARTPQQNGVAERRNRTLIEAARTMLADAKLPVTFWAEAVNTACYVQNMVL